MSRPRLGPGVVVGSRVRVTSVRFANGTPSSILDGQCGMIRTIASIDNNGVRFLDGGAYGEAIDALLELAPAVLARKPGEFRVGDVVEAKVDGFYLSPHRFTVGGIYDNGNVEAGSKCSQPDCEWGLHVADPKRLILVTPVEDATNAQGNPGQAPPTATVERPQGGASSGPRPASPAPLPPTYLLEHGVADVAAMIVTGRNIDGPYRYCRGCHEYVTPPAVRHAADCRVASRLGEPRRTWR